jgi:hypothetical protein
MWTKISNVVEVKGRRMVAKDRFDMSYNMGPLK